LAPPRKSPCCLPTPVHPPPCQAIELFEGWERRAARRHAGRRPFHRYRAPGAAGVGAGGGGGGDGAAGAEQGAAAMEVEGSAEPAAAAQAAEGGPHARGAAAKPDVFLNPPDLVRRWGC
jgi:hypothetical protein